MSILELEIKSLNKSGDGVAYFENQEYFIAYTLPQELVSAEFTSNKRKPNHLKIVDI